MKFFVLFLRSDEFLPSDKYIGSYGDTNFGYYSFAVNQNFSISYGGGTLTAGPSFMVNVKDLNNHNLYVRLYGNTSSYMHTVTNQTMTRVSIGQVGTAATYDISSYDYIIFYLSGDNSSNYARIVSK